MKRILSSILAIILCFGIFSTTALAAENCVPAEEVISVGIQENTRASTIPTSFYNLAGNNYYKATLIDLAANRGSYSKYYFATGTGELHFWCELQRSGSNSNTNRDLLIYVYEHNTNRLVGVSTIHFTSATCSVSREFTNLSENSLYYVRFFNNSSTDPGDSFDISGTIYMDDVDIAVL